MKTSVGDPPREAVRLATASSSARFSSVLATRTVAHAKGAVLSSKRISCDFVFAKIGQNTAVPDEGRPPGALVLTKLVGWYRFGVGDKTCFCHFFVIVLSSERINGQRAKTSRKTMRERVPPLQNSKNPHAKWAAKPPTCGSFVEFWRGGTRSRIVFLVVFAGRPSMLSDDNRFEDFQDGHLFGERFRDGSLKSAQAPHGTPPEESPQKAHCSTRLQVTLTSLHVL